MKILIILDVLDSGGVSIVLQNLLKNIDLKKFEITLLLFNKNNYYENQLPKNIKIKHVYNVSPANSKSAIIRYIYGVFKELIPSFLIRKFLLKDTYDLNIDFKGNNLNVLVAAKGRKIIWNHKDFSLESNPVERKMLETYGKTFRYKYKNYMRKKAYKYSDSIVCISDKMRNAFISRFGFIDKTVTLFNPIDSNEIIRKANENIQLAPQKAFRFCCLSRISTGKGIERLFDAVEKLNEEQFDFEVLIVGGGDTYENMTKLLSTRKIKNITMIGHQNNPYPYLKAADAFVCPSETEAFPTVLCEAVILSLPIITTNVGSVDEILDNGKYGLIVENNTEGIYEGMKLFLQDKNVAMQYREKVKKRNVFFDITKSVGDIEKYFKEIYDLKC